MQIQINENGKITGFATVGGFVDGVEVESIPEGFAEAFQLGKYRYENGEILEGPDFTPPVDNTALLNEIEERKAELGATDYKALKYMEGWLTEEEYAPVKAQRQVLRDQINELEGKL